MKGDFTRGHLPDKKRGEKYRRVLLQEGRLVTDSDVAAGVDAIDTLLRDLGADLGCQTGSPNLGYLVTPGPLLALFETLDGVDLPAPGGDFKAYRDYEAKLQERFPSIYIGAQAAAGTVKIAGRRSLAAGAYSQLRFWVKGTAQLAVKIEGVPALPIVATDATKFAPYDVAIPGGPTSYQNIEIGFDSPGAGNEAWIALIEGVEPAQTAPHFWFTRGRYYLRGLGVESAEDGQYSEATFPHSKGFEEVPVEPAPGGYLVAYLEGWERLVTRIEDAGILEQALGGALDTTVRSKAVGQVKVALFKDGDPGTDAAEVPAAFANVDVGTGKLQVTTKVTVENLDPCAIPETGGYTGADNRLYRFEVHTGGDLGDADFKWSKNNGADAFAVTGASSDFLTMAAGAQIRDGDLVELLTETDDLGDAAGGNATISLAAPKFRPSTRRVGKLFYAETTATSGQIKLRDLDTKLSTSVPADFVTHDPKRGARYVRVWHGRLVTQHEPGNPPGPTTDFDIGDGIHVKLSGADFRPGDYWQHEARKLKDNDNGPNVNQPRGPDGPERLFAPLALLSLVNAGSPLTLVRWYDHQYSAICELNADDIAYDGVKVGTPADTVQEALDELYLREQGGCCDVSLSPSKTPGDDTPRIQKVLDTLDHGGTLCLRQGVYDIAGSLTFGGRRITIAGCPGATLVGRGKVPVFVISGEAQLTLRDLLVVVRDGKSPVAQLDLPFSGSGEEEGGNTPIPLLSLVRTTLVHAGDNGPAVQVGSPGIAKIDPQKPDPLYLYSLASFGAVVQAEDSTLLAWSGILAEHLDTLTLNRSLIVFGAYGVGVMTVEGVQLSGSTIQGWLRADWNPFQLIRDVDPPNLEWAVSKTLEQGAGGYPAPGTIALLAGEMRWRGSSIEDSSLGGGAALYAGWATDLHSRGSTYLGVSGPAVRMDAHYQARFVADEIRGDASVGFWAPWHTSGLEITECSIIASIGVLFAATVDGEILPDGVDAYSAIYGARLHGNEINCWSRGISFGPAIPEQEESHPPFVTIERVEVTSNTWPWYSQVGISCTVADPPSWNGEEVRTPRILIAQNRVDAGVGILAVGNDVVARENAIHATYRIWNGSTILGFPLLSATRIGVYLTDGGRAVVAGNVVNLDPSQSEDEGRSIGVLLHEVWSEGERDDNVVRDNKLVATQPLWVPPGVTGAGTHGLTVEGNRMEGFRAGLIQVYESVVRGNTCFCELRLTASSDNVVSANKVTPPLDGHLGLIIRSAGGTWQVEDNRVGGVLLIQPEMVPYSPDADKYKAFIELILFWQDPQNGGASGSINFQTAQALFNWYLATLGLASINKELEYAVQVEGNWASRDLVVGSPTTSFTTTTGTYQPALADIQSAVQIVGNRADGGLVTNAYARLVFAHNFAQAYNASGWSQVGPITSPNFDAP
ncbi:MAG: hypothetical protein U0441_17535 [Polyangiaceae bacterium]